MTGQSIRPSRGSRKRRRRQSNCDDDPDGGGGPEAKKIAAAAPITVCRTTKRPSCPEVVEKELQSAKPPPVVAPSQAALSWWNGTGDEDRAVQDERERERLSHLVRRWCAALLPPPSSPALTRRPADGAVVLRATTTKSNNKPTPLQEDVWRAAFVVTAESDAFGSSGSRAVAVKNFQLRSCVVLGPTASGKTLAYGAPLLLRSSMRHGNTGDGSLVLVPTRELALQVAGELERAAARLAVTATMTGDELVTAPAAAVAIVACYGGVDRSRQWDSLRRAIVSSSEKGSSGKGGFVAVGTPGRLVDLLLDDPPTTDQPAVDLGAPPGPGASSALRRAEKEGATTARLRRQMRDSIGCTAIDEADRMGLQPDLARQVTELLSSLESVDSVFLASATFPARVREQWDTWIRRSVSTTAGGGRCAVVRLESSGAPDDTTPVAALSSAAVPSDGCGSGAATAPASTVAHFEAAPTAASVAVTKPDRDRVEGCVHSVASRLDKAGNKQDDWRALIPSHVEQVVHVCADHKKPRKLLRTLQTLRDRTKKTGKTGNKASSSLCGIVFFNTVKRLREAANLLHKEKNLATAFGELHGRLDQATRERTLRCFRSGRVPLLLATDVAARGLHVEHASFVVNYDFPASLEQYVHRCGRAGRWQRSPQGTEAAEGATPSVVAAAAAKTRIAVAHSFFPRRLAPLAPDLVHILESCGQWVDPNLRELAANAAQNAASSATCSTSSPSRPRRPDRADHSACSRGSSTVQGRPRDPGDQGDDNGAKDDDDEFGALSGLRIALRRASHVSDASSESDDSETDNDEASV